MMVRGSKPDRRDTRRTAVGVVWGWVDQATGLLRRALDAEAARHRQVAA